LDRTEQETGYKWLMTEGLRTNARQLWLYAQGRTRPGKIVTWLRVPKRHNLGLASDNYPTTNGRTPNFQLPHSNYQIFRKHYLAEGLVCPPWRKGDYGHVEAPESNTALTQQARAWVRAGFPQDPAVKPIPTEIPVYVDGELIPDADAYRQGDGVIVALRPVVEALDWEIFDGTPPTATLIDERVSVEVPMFLRGDRGFAQVADVARLLGVHKEWDGKAVRLS
jgi:hypothetical protein